jgi:hypothetical protein
MLPDNYARQRLGELEGSVCWELVVVCVLIEKIGTTPYGLTRSTGSVQKMDKYLRYQHTAEPQARANVQIMLRLIRL